MYTLRKYHHLPALQAGVSGGRGERTPKGKTGGEYDSWGSSLRGLAQSTPPLGGDWLSSAKLSRHHVTLCQSPAGGTSFTSHLQLRPAVSSSYLLPLHCLNGGQRCKIQIERDGPRTPENRTPKPNQPAKQKQQRRRWWW